MSNKQISCEFCNELKSFEESRVGKIYKKYIDNRIIKQSDNFFVVPTIGQIIPGSLLILPKKHFETFAQIPINLIQESLSLINFFANDSVGKDFILWEHGATECTGSSCGVYHAHIHMIPVQKKIDPENLVGENAFEDASLERILLRLKNESNYILFKNIDNRFYYNLKENCNAERFQSQYFRKWLVSNFDLTREWDWKKYDYVESDLLTSLV